MSLKDDFLAGRKLAISDPVAECRGVCVRELTGGERKALDQRRYKSDGQGKYLFDPHTEDINWVTACACGPDGVRIFEEDWKDAKTLEAAVLKVAGLPDLDLESMAAKAMDINAYGSAAVRAAAKNSAASLTSFSLSGWLWNLASQTLTGCWSA